MILGSFTFSDSDNLVSEINRILSFIDQYDHFKIVTNKCIAGAYYLHSNLPLGSDDLYYSDTSSDIVVLLSGFIYNKHELLSHFDANQPVNEPELIAHMFLNDGPGFVEKLNGDFAIFIGLPGKGECFLFRDQVGIRPLVWTVDDKTFCFSSEINGLCRAFSEGETLDTDYLLGYLKYIDYKKTPNRNVLKLLPGHYLRYSREGVEIIKYWHPEKIRTDTTLQYDQMLSDLRSILYDSVKIRCDNRFIAGAHVSGGIDSGIISALARSNFKHQKKFCGFSWSPANFTSANLIYDERDLVVKFCKETDIDPSFSTLSSDEFPDLLSSYYYNHGFFSEDSTSTQAAKTNTNLIFSGWGGDEFISTGDRGIELDLLRKFKFALYLKRNPLRRPVKLLRYLLSFVIFPAAGILESETAKSFKDEARYLKRTFKRSDKKAVDNFYFHTSRHQLHLNMLKFYHIQERCECWTIIGFRKGIEYRYPLLDKRIIEYMLKVPSELLCQTDYFRPVLREIGKGILPEAVRLNWDKSDPVYWSWMDELFRTTAIRLMKEVSVWKTNPDLNFVEFELLEKDIQKFRNNLLKVNPKLLYRSLVYIKTINDFTIQYGGTKS